MQRCPEIKQTCRHQKNKVPGILFSLAIQLLVHLFLKPVALYDYSVYMHCSKPAEQPGVDSNAYLTPVKPNILK